MAIGLRNKVNVEGLGRIVNGLRRFNKETKSRVILAMQEAVILVEADAKRLMSRGSLRAVDTGRLRASLTSKVHTTVNKGYVLGEVGTNVHYGIYVHEGTKKMSERPFLTEALKRNKKNIQIILRGAYRQ
ncbi:MAG: hypothetical protein GF317_04840 [Candidatus Lokiarchaeota archaeon]|nr:hypothetical protein [Candidatus Lokiarchaeota archaeon]